MALSRPFKENRCELPSCTPSSLFRAIDGETYLALSQNAIALQAPQHFRPSQLQANCDCWFARQSVSPVISFSTPGTARSPLHPVISSIAWTQRRWRRCPGQQPAAESRAQLPWKQSTGRNSNRNKCYWYICVFRCVVVAIFYVVPIKMMIKIAGKRRIKLCLLSL